MKESLTAEQISALEISATNDLFVIGGIPWATLKVKRLDPRFDKADFWVSLTVHV